jgi:pectate lyase
VLLTDEEYLDFQARHTDWQERIEKMSAYMQANNKQYKDHFATLELWAMKDKEKQKEAAQTKTTSNNPFANALKGMI